MSHDSNGRIFTQNGQGIDVRADVAYVLGRSTGDVGQLCGDVDASGARLTTPKINEWSLYKPYRHASPETTLANRQAAMYGWDVPIKQAGQSTADFVSEIYRRTTSVGDKVWDFLPPRGLGGGAGGANEMYRILDFDGYSHGMLPLGSPVEYDTVGAISIGTIATTQTLDGNNSSVQRISSGRTIHYTGQPGYHIEFNAAPVDPSPGTTGVNVNVYGQVLLKWRNIKQPDYSYTLNGNVFQWSSGASVVSGYWDGSFPSSWENGEYYSIDIELDLTNRTRVVSTGEYISQGISINVPSAFVYERKSDGRDGVYIKPAVGLPGWDSAAAIFFGNNSNFEPMAIIMRYGYGTDCISKISQAAGYGGYIMFDTLPSPQTHGGACTSFLVYGNPGDIFGAYENSKSLSAADAARLVAAPYAVHIFF